ncbi:modular serine protease-like isoform X1 [Frieseomelitta varia]|uniref:modular serine protease-like isoform X1 n=1 Tax=Frieseomelitta varia TaxID=561572 RepID=UPI001CB68DF2|nr:modular serine protease-like isoform X1 [Frieseomelitta varia]XP_043524496.1 modular serine protease-like isoform X1 [Frieseomelitta varia]
MKNTKIIILTIIFGLIERGCTQCGTEKFQCKNGDCIKSELLCDGSADCKDKSDETVVECTKPEIICQRLAFRCSYGACIDGDKTCNGEQDCIDNSDETLPTCRSVSFNTSSFNSCGKNQFKCDDGQCIAESGLCDGKIDCIDNSDETIFKCSTITCPQYLFRCTYGACIDGDLKCNGVTNCADGSDEDPKICRNTSEKSSTTIRPTIRPSTSSPITPGSISCTAPPKPENGYWKLDQSYWRNGKDKICDNCDVPQGTKLAPGQELIYGCNSGYKLTSSASVFCNSQGQWINIPECKEIRCKGLISSSRSVECMHNGKYVPCSDVVPGTTAKLKCRDGYHIEKGSTLFDVRCNETGGWFPEPIQCVPACGIQPLNFVPAIVNGTRPDVFEFPWHASLYRAMNSTAPKEFICGATIIHERLLVTAAHCVFDESGITPKVYDASKFHIAAGNIFRNYDSPLHEDTVVQKAQVKHIYYICEYNGYKGNYADDIAVLEIKDTFNFSSILLPVCLDDYGWISLEDGLFGKVAGFGRTAFGISSLIIQKIEVPFIPFERCKTLSSTYDTRHFITTDKFCAGYTNGSAVCEGDSGGGLVFNNSGLWYLKGIVSVGLGTKQEGGNLVCDNYAYSLYTKISSHMSWIQNIIFKIDKPSLLNRCPS